MKTLKHSVLALLMMMLPMMSMAHLPTMIQGKITPSLAPILKKITPAIVNIVVDKKAPLTLQEAAERIKKKKPLHEITVGSGVIINAKQGLIVTNAHVISNEKIILVTLKDGRRFHAKLIGKDAGFDIAILRIHANKLTSIPFGDSDQLKVGDFVAAIGSPYGLTQTVTSGVISALNRSQPKIEGYQSFIQTDAPINPGNSGGALVNLKGQFIGMNTAIITPTFGSIGIGFSIPSNMVHSVVTQLLKYGKVERGMLGVLAQNISPDLADALRIDTEQGVIVTKVVPGSAAQIAGIKVKDIIKKVNNKPIHNAVQLRNMLGIMRPGTSLQVAIVRNGRPMLLSATVGNPKKILAQHEMPFIAGLSLRNFDELESNGTQLKGVIVTDISETSEGALAGLLPGDVITSANTEKVTSIKQLEKIANQQTKQLLLTVTRRHENLFVVLEPQ